MRGDRVRSDDVKSQIMGRDVYKRQTQHARDFAAAGVPFVFDPGQGIPMFSGEELLDFMRLANYACFNDYEAKLLSEDVYKRQRLR